MKNLKIKRSKKYSNRINSKKGRGICNFLCRNIKEEAQKKAENCDDSIESLEQEYKQLQEKIKKLDKEFQQAFLEASNLSVVKNGANSSFK